MIHRIKAAMAHAQVLYQQRTTPAKMKFNIKKIDQYPGHYNAMSGLGWGLLFTYYLNVAKNYM